VDSSIEVIADVHHDVLGDVAHHVLMNVKQDAFYEYEKQQEPTNGGHYRELIRFTDPGKAIDQRSQLIL